MSKSQAMPWTILMTLFSLILNSSLIILVLKKFDTTELQGDVKQSEAIQTSYFYKQ